MAFNFAGAGAGASDALQQLLARAFEEQQARQRLALQQQELEQRRRESDVEMADRAQQRKMQSAQIRASLLQPGPIGAADTEALSGTPFEALLERKQTLPSSSSAATGLPVQADAGGQDYATLRPTAAQMAQAGERDRRRVVGELFQRGAPRNQILAALAQGGQDITSAMLATPDAPSDFTLSPGSTRFSPTGQRIASVPPTPPQTSGSEWVTMTSPTGDMRMVPKGAQANALLAQRWKISDTGRSRAPIGQERTALAFYNRGKQASDTLIDSGLEERIAKSGAMAQLQGQFAPNLLQTQDQQLYRQAQRAFTEARLRKESGAAVPQSEYDNDARTYFAQPGDTAEVMEQKRQGRQAVLDGIAFQSGAAYEEYYGQPFQKNAAGVNPTANAGGGKTITRAQIQAIAQRKGLTPAQVEAASIAQGYTVQ